MPETTTTSTPPTFTVYQPGLEQLRTILDKSPLSRSQINSLLDHLDTRNILFAAFAVAQNSGGRGRDLIHLINTAMDLAQKEANFSKDVVPTAKVILSSQPETEIERLTENFSQEYPPEVVENPASYQSPYGENPLLRYLSQESKKQFDEHLSQIWEKFQDSHLGRQIEAHTTTAPLLSTTESEITTAAIVTAEASTGALMSTPTMAIVAVGPQSATAAAAGQAPQLFGKITGFAMPADSVSGAIHTDLFQSGMIKEISGKSVTQSFSVAAQSNLKYFQLTEKGLGLAARSSRFSSVLSYVSQQAGVTTFTAATGAGVASTAGIAAGTAASTTAGALTAGAAAGTASATATGAAVGAAGANPVTIAIGAAVGFVVSKSKQIFQWLKDNLAPFVGLLTFGTIFGLTSSLASAVIGGLAATGATSFASSAISGFGSGTGLGSSSVSATATRINVILSTLASEVASVSVAPIFITIIALPAVIALFLIIINSSAYVVPPASRRFGPGGLYPSCWPVDSGRITSLPPHGAYNTLDAFDIGLPNGSPVYASHDGVAITFVDPRTPAQGSYGNYIKVMSVDGSFCTLYGHLAGFTVSSNTPVTAGTQIGTSNNTGTSTGPHLHYEYQEPCTAYAGNIVGDNRIINYVPPGFALGASIQYPGSCFASQQGGSNTSP